MIHHKIVRSWPFPWRSTSTMTSTLTRASSLTAAKRVDPTVDLNLASVVALRRSSQHRIGRRPTSMVGSTSYVAVDLDALGQRAGRRRRSRTPCRRLETNHQTGGLRLQPRRPPACRRTCLVGWAHERHEPVEHQCELHSPRRNPRRGSNISRRGGSMPPSGHRRATCTR